MISTNEKEAMLELFGGRYSIKIQEFLKKKKIKTRAGKTPSTSMIRSVMTGEKGHDKIEGAIVEFYGIKKAELKARNEVFENA